MMPYMEIGYLIGSVSFVVGLKMMGQPDSARKGNLVAAFGMAMAVIAALFFNSQGYHVINNLSYILIAIVAGTVIGTLMAKRVQMTAMPEMVSLFNGMGGLSAALISIIEWRHLLHEAVNPERMSNMPVVTVGMYIPVIAGLIIGTISFVGSIVAWGKLNGKIGDFRFPSQQIINAVVFLPNDWVGCGIWVVVCVPHWWGRHARCNLFVELFHRGGCRLWWILVREQGNVDGGRACRFCRYHSHSCDV